MVSRCYAPFGSGELAAGYLAMNSLIPAPLTSVQACRTPRCMVGSPGLFGSAVQRVMTTLFPAGKPAPSASDQGAAMNLSAGL